MSEDRGISMTYSTEYLGSLLQEIPELNPYDTPEKEIAAVKLGAKALACFDATLSGAADDCESLVGLCAGHDLLLTVSSPSGRDANIGACQMFVYRNEESWRLPALGALRSISRHGHKWSEALEALESNLLGYSEEQTAEWLRHFSKYNVGWAGTTVYLIMPRAQRENLRRFGDRCIDPSRPQEITLFCGQVGTAVTTDSVELLNRDLAIGRLAIGGAAFKGVLGEFLHEDQILVRRDLDEDVSIVLNQGICSRIEFLENDIWK